MNSAGSTDISLVPFAAAHRAATLRWMNDPVLMPRLNRLHVITAEEHEVWFAGLAARRDVAYYAIEAGTPRHHVGNVWLHAIDPVHRKAEVRILLDPDVIGRGLGTTALRQLVDTGRQFHRLHRFYAYVLAGNIPAQRAFTKAGFGVEGRLIGDRWNGQTFEDVLAYGWLGKA